MKGMSHERLNRLKTLIYKAILIACIGVTVAILIVLSGIRELAYRTMYIANRNENTEEIVPFPLGVDPEKKLIYENPAFDAYIRTQSSTTFATRIVESNWFTRALGTLARLSWYQNFASPSTKILVIQSGERKEQVVDNFADILKWNNDERNTFTAKITNNEPYLAEGVLHPDTYTVAKDADPEETADLIIQNFKENVLSRYTEEIDQMVPLENALIIASLLEREAYDFEDMRHIAGIIWNRLFIGMNLQLDASLQYAKATEQNWWPAVIPQDKYIESPFNTYTHEGLPPAPIANPSVESILAALNPLITECLFYFHDRDGKFHCTKSYEEHVTLLKQYYGRGR